MIHTIFYSVLFNLFYWLVHVYVKYWKSILNPFCWIDYIEILHIYEDLAEMQYNGSPDDQMIGIEDLLVCLGQILKKNCTLLRLTPCVKSRLTYVNLVTMQCSDDIEDLVMTLKEVDDNS